MQIWDAPTGEQMRTLRLPKGTDGYSGAPHFSPDGRTIYAGLANYRITSTRKEGKVVFDYKVDGEITVWDVASGRQLPSLRQTPPHAVIGVTPSSDGATLLSHDFVSADAVNRPPRVLTQWDLRTGKNHQLLDGGWIPIFAPDGKTFAASSTETPLNPGKILLWDVASRKEKWAIAETRKGHLVATAFSRDGRYLTGVWEPRESELLPEVKLWDAATGKEVMSFAAPKGTTPFRRPGFITGAFGWPTFSPDGSWLAAYLHIGRVYLFDVAGRKLAWSQDVKNGWLREQAFSPDGRWLAVAAQDSPEDLKPREEISPFDLPQPRIFLFDLKAGGPPEEIVAPHGRIGRLAFSPDSKTLALSGTGCVWLFDVKEEARNQERTRRNAPEP